MVLTKYNVHKKHIVKNNKIAKENSYLSIYISNGGGKPEICELISTGNPLNERDLRSAGRLYTPL